MPTKLQLPSSVSSPQDLASLMAEVQSYARWFSQALIKQKVKAGSVAQPPELSAAANELIQTQVAKSPVSQQLLDELIATLDQYKREAPSIIITLAAPAPGDLKQTLVAWCRKNISTDILVTFKFNATILGGMVVNYGSHIFDWSFRRQILAARGKFPEVLRHV